MLKQLRGPWALFFFILLASCSYVKVKESPRNALDEIKKKDLIGLWQNNKSYMLIKNDGSVSYKLDASEKRACQDTKSRRPKPKDCKSVVYQTGYILGFDGDQLVIDLGTYAQRLDLQEDPYDDKMILGDIRFHRRPEE